MAEALFEVRGVSKRFGAIRALRNVDFSVAGAEVHALVGENGAGKSTLVKILSGAYRADSGTILHAGRPYVVASPAAARARGVAMIYQELTLAPHLTVAQNLTLGIERTRCGVVREDRTRLRAALERLGHGGLDLDAPVRTLSIGLQQVVEIARALISNARLVIMDEPTSSLSAEDVQALFTAVARLREAGVGVVYISHFLEEVMRVADRYTVLRDGATVGTGRVDAVTIGDLVELMVGRSLSELFPRVPHTLGDTVLEVAGLSGTALPRDVSFTLRAGEVFGVAGLVGSGRSEMLRAIFGLDRAARGVVRCGGREWHAARLTPARALALRLDLLSENRKDEGLATPLSIRTNITLSGLERLSRLGVVRRARERACAEHWCERLAIRCRDAEQAAAALSGGNQQKVALARILNHDSRVLLLDEPTRGIDVGSKAEVCRVVGELARSGKAVIVVSSYLPELFGICDTLAVMHRGRLSPKRPLREWTTARVMAWATSGREAAA